MPRGPALVLSLLVAGALAALPTRADAPPPFPVEIEARFDLIAHDGARVASNDLVGRTYLLFFGYTRCEAICDVALPRMAEALDHLAARGLSLPAYMITIDPAYDDAARLAQAMPRLHEGLVGLTGSEGALGVAYDAFQVSREVVYRDPVGDPVYAHTSFVFVVGPEGRVVSALPPIVDAGHLAEVVARHLLAAAG